MRLLRRALVVVIALSLLLPGIGVRAQGDLTAKLQAALDEITSSDGPAAVVMITTPDGSFSAAEGLVDIEGDQAAAVGDRFRIGSVSKTFVAVVALQLADEGVIALDDPAQKWLPPDVVDHLANADQATIRQLMSMRSGIPEYLNDAFVDAIDADPTHPWTALEALKYAYDQDPLFEPGADFEYTNTNYVLMQLILEQATGKPLHTLVRDRILDPVGLKDTYSQAHEDLPGGFVHGYLPDDNGDLEDVTDINDGAGLGDGALISTAADLTTFYRALLQDRTLLSENAMQEFLDFQAAGEGDEYGLGIERYDTDWGSVTGHSGEVYGFASLVIYLPDYETTAVILSANEDTDIETALDDALAAVLGE